MVHRTPPSLPVTLAVFLVCGPLFMMWAWLIAGSELAGDLPAAFAGADVLEIVSKAAMALLIGMTVWLSWLFGMSGGWMLTLLPTVSAALLFRVAALRLVRFGRWLPHSRLQACVLSALIACGVATPVFALLWAARAWLGEAPVALVRSDLLQVVAIDAVLVGLVLGLFWRRPSA